MKKPSETLMIAKSCLNCKYMKDNLCIKHEFVINERLRQDIFKGAIAFQVYCNWHELFSHDTEDYLLGIKQIDRINGFHKK